MKGKGYITNRLNNRNIQIRNNQGAAASRAESNKGLTKGKHTQRAGKIQEHELVSHRENLTRTSDKD